MDLGTARARLSAGAYDDNTEAFAADCRLVWANCKLFNLPGSRIWAVAHAAEAFFETLHSDWILPLTTKASETSSAVRSPLSIRRRAREKIRGLMVEFSGMQQPSTKRAAVTAILGPILAPSTSTVAPTRDRQVSLSTAVEKSSKKVRTRKVSNDAPAPAAFAEQPVLLAEPFQGQIEEWIGKRIGTCKPIRLQLPVTQTNNANSLSQSGKILV
jgi:hypothetical protein